MELLFLSWATSTSLVSLFLGWMMYLPHFEQRNCFDILGNREYLFMGNAGPTDSQGCSWWLISCFFMVHCQMERIDRAEEAHVFLNWS